MSVHGLDRPVKWTRRSILACPYGIHWAHAAKGGGPVLRTEVSWRTISGVLVNTPRGAVWLYWRRWGL